MDGGREFIDALVQVSEEKGIDREVIFEAIETSLVTACKKQIGANAILRVQIDRETGVYTVFSTKTIVETVTDDVVEININDAQLINAQLEIGDNVEVNVTPKNFGRIAAQNAKQAVVQKFREAEREILYNEYIDKENEVLTGIVQRRDKRNIMVEIGKLEAIIPTSEQMARDSYTFQDRLRVYVLEVKQHTKGPMVTVSRTHPELLRKLFEQEIPEVSDGTVEVKSVAREAGMRSKISVYSKHPQVDPIGACVGQNGQRVNMISAELCGEKIDIVVWSDSPDEYIVSALSPSKVVAIATNPHEMVAHVVVPDNQLSLAIGKEGQNARLAARLTGWRIDIKSATQAQGTDFLNFPDIEDKDEENEIVIDNEMEAAYTNFYKDVVMENNTEPEEEKDGIKEAKKEKETTKETKESKEKAKAIEENGKKEESISVAKQTDTVDSTENITESKEIVSPQVDITKAEEIKATEITGDEDDDEVDYGYYDENGEFHYYEGYYDEDGNFVFYDDYYDEDGKLIEYPSTDDDSVSEVAK